MEPTSKALQSLSNAHREAASGLSRSPLDVLQVVNLKRDIGGASDLFRNLLQAEQQPKPVPVGKPEAMGKAGTAPSATSADNPGKADRADAHDCGNEDCGKASPVADKNLPQASNAQDNAAPVDEPEQASQQAAAGEESEANSETATAEEPEVVQESAAATQDETGTALEEPEESALSAAEGVPGDLPLESATATAGDVSGDVGVNEGEPVPEGSVPGSAGEQVEIQATADPEVDADSAAVTAELEENGSERPDAIAAPVDGARVTGTEKAGERLTANMERNPDAAGDGLRNAREAVGRTVSAATAATATAQPAAGSQTPAEAEISRPGPGVAAEAKTETISRAPETAAPRPAASETAPVQRAVPHAEMAVQLRMPAVAAQQVEQALAARTQTSEVVDGKVAQVAQAAAVGATAAASVSSASSTTAPVTEAARAALQQVRGSFTRPGWDMAMAQRVAQMAARGVQSAQIEVDPPELGPVKVVIQVNNEQQTSVSFSSPHAAVREALEMTAQRLRDALAEGGLDLADVDVSDQSAEGQESADDDQTTASSSSHRVLGNVQPEAEEAKPVSVRDSDALVDHYV